MEKVTIKTEELQELQDLLNEWPEMKSILKGALIAKKLDDNAKKLNDNYEELDDSDDYYQDHEESFVDSFLGKVMQDEITGLKGKVTAVAFNLDSVTTAYVVPKLKTGNEPAWVNVSNLKHVDSFITKNND